MKLQPFAAGDWDLAVLGRDGGQDSGETSIGDPPAAIDEVAEDDSAASKTLAIKGNKVR